MKSLNERRVEKILREFVGPKGQVDPTGYQPVSMPSVFPQAAVGSARPGMAPTTMQTPPQDDQQSADQQQQDTDQQSADQQQANQDQGVNNDPNAQQQDPNSILPPGLQRYIKMIGSRSPQQIVAIKNAFNQAVQNLLMNKSKSAGRMGMMTNFNQARDMKATFGQPPANPSAPQ